MTHDELQGLLLNMVDDLNHLKRSREYLEIALEQLDDSDDKCTVRLELLLSTYLSVINCHLDELDSVFRKLERASAKTSCGFIELQGIVCTLQ
jgi:hypothetical protein